MAVDQKKCLNICRSSVSTQKALFQFQIFFLDLQLLIDVDDQNKLHWLVINIPKDDYHKGDTIAKYSSPTPPLGHTHRYVMMVMPQEHLLIESEIQQYSRSTACETHGDLNPTEFQDTRGLSPPVAINFFTVSHTEFVDRILAFCGQKPIVS